MRRARTLLSPPQSSSGGDMTSARALGRRSRSTTMATTLSGDNAGCGSSARTAPGRVRISREASRVAGAISVREWRSLRALARAARCGVSSPAATTARAPFKMYHISGRSRRARALKE